MASTIGEFLRHYTWLKNFAEGERDYLFQGRFGSCVLDEPHFLAATSYGELNPVNAGLATQAWD